MWDAICHAAKLPRPTSATSQPPSRHKFLNCRINRKLAFSPFWDLWGTSDKKTKGFSGIDEPLRLRSANVDLGTLGSFAAWQIASHTFVAESSADQPLQQVRRYSWAAAPAQQTWRLPVALQAFLIFWPGGVHKAALMMATVCRMLLSSKSRSACTCPFYQPLFHGTLAWLQYFAHTELVSNHLAGTGCLCKASTEMHLTSSYPTTL